MLVSSAPLPSTRYKLSQNTKDNVESGFEVEHLNDISIRWLYERWV